MQVKASTVSALHALLDEERELLLAGDLNALPDLLKRKQGLIEDLGDPVEADLTDLHGKLTRNHALLSSAMDGIRKVSDRLGELRKIRQSLETYDKQGQRQFLGSQATGRMEKRA